MSEQNCCCCSSGCCGEPVVKTVSTRLTAKDILGNWKVRWGIGRMNHTVEPGLYAVGEPDGTSPILVSANYKLTFDSLRKELSGLNCWLLILDTKGINVWCAAGKGTFGTNELITQLTKTRVSEKLLHRTLILPQLGASGINANEVKQKTGFSVIFGPVRAKDIKSFLASGNQATEDMRTVQFTIWDRLILTPMEMVPAAKKSIVLFGVLFLINLFSVNPFGLADFVALSGAALVGTFLTPVLLPFIPGRAFSLKGGLLGVIWAAFMLQFVGFDHSELGTSVSLLGSIGYLLILPSISAYLAMNFTGSSTYTSPSGVRKEMRIALPMMITASTLGSILLLLNRIFGL